MEGDFPRTTTQFQFFKMFIVVCGGVGRLKLCGENLAQNGKCASNRQSKVRKPTIHADFKPFNFLQQHKNTKPT